MATVSIHQIIPGKMFAWTTMLLSAAGTLVALVRVFFL
jgi:hypothetical protein